MKHVTVNQEVAFNNLPDAVWFTVEAIDGFTLTVREVGTRYKTQEIDSDCVKQVREQSFENSRSGKACRMTKVLRKFHEDACDRGDMRDAGIALQMLALPMESLTVLCLALEAAE